MIYNKTERFTIQTVFNICINKTIHFDTTNLYGIVLFFVFDYTTLKYKFKRECRCRGI